MGGKVLEYEAKTILNRGRTEGREEGLEQGLYMAINTVSKNMGISLEEACRVLEMSMEEYLKAEKLVNQKNDE